ncbi:chemerin-like receptor 1 [Danio aesculapii]|uniref:chemerin-like receptor 1 n=1 Tax=Danio aesculapii TaxID=1142201 RepID=UPI0024BF8871|nr:chemerin-like receptor 1 [Danio aesculapii]
MSDHNSEYADYDAIIYNFTRMDNYENKPHVQPVNKTDTNPHGIKMAYFITYCIVLIFGVTLNFSVIVFGCCKHKSLPKVAVWIMALAATHLASCVSVVLQLLYAHNNFKWNYGNVSCKLSSYFTYGSMLSTASMLSLWSISSIFSNNTCFKKSKNCNVILISFAWTIAAILASPSLFSREVREEQCIDDYDLDDNSETSDGLQKLQTVVVMRFLTGLLGPAMIIFVSCCVASKTRKCKLCRKQAEIICAIKIIYFVCWAPQIFLTMLQATVSISLGLDMLNYGLPVVTMLAMSHCFISPLFYLFLGRSLKMEWMIHDTQHHEDDLHGKLERVALNN